MYYTSRVCACVCAELIHINALTKRLLTFLRHISEHNQLIIIIIADYICHFNNNNNKPIVIWCAVENLHLQHLIPSHHYCYM